MFKVNGSLLVLYSVAVFCHFLKDHSICFLLPAKLFHLSTSVSYFLCADFLAETEPGDAAFPIPAFPAAAAGTVQSGARAPGTAAAGNGAGASAQGAAAAGSPLLRYTGHAGSPPARPQGNHNKT